MAEIAASCGVTPMTVYRHITTATVTGEASAARSARPGGVPQASSQ